MNAKTLAILNLVALVLLYTSFIPWNSQLAQILVLIVAIMLFVKQ